MYKAIYLDLYGVTYLAKSREKSKVENGPKHFKPRTHGKNGISAKSKFLGLLLLKSKSMFLQDGSKEIENATIHYLK